jgi:outer membrane protein assembly factor BamB
MRAGVVITGNFRHFRFLLMRFISLALVATLLSSCGLFGGDEIEDPPADLIKFKPTLKVKKIWSANVGDGAEHLRLALTAASDGTQIFAAAHDGRVSAYDALKGKRLWRTKTKLPLSAGPAIGGTVLVMGSSNGDVIALDAGDGHKLWQISVSSEVLAPPAITSDLVLVRTVDGKLVALDLTDGSQIWFTQQSVPRLSVRGTGSPVVKDNVVFCGFDNGRLAAYELTDGTLLWEILVSPPSGRTEIDRLSDLNATIRVIGDDIYIVGYQGVLSALAAESGQILWSREISSHSGIGVDLSNLYVSGESSDLFAVVRTSGRELWRKEILLHRDITGPTAFNSSVVVGDFEGYVHWFDATSGELQARTRAGSDRVTGSPLVVNEMIYVLTDGGKLYAFRDVTRKKES